MGRQRTRCGGALRVLQPLPGFDTADRSYTLADTADSPPCSMPSFAYKHTAFATQPCKGFFLVNCPSDTYGAKETCSFLQALENGAESDGSLVKHIGDGESNLEFAQM